MTEIPEHLRARASALRKAAGLEGAVTGRRLKPRMTPPDDMERNDPAWWDQWERTTTTAHWFMEDPDDPDNALYITVQEHYVGKDPNFTTLCYRLNINDEDHVFVEMDVTGKDLIQLGAKLQETGLRIMGLG